MNKLLLILVFVIGMLSNAAAGTFTFQPNPEDLYDLDHYESYSWGIDWDIPTGETIVGASLFFDNIRNWDDNENVLYVHLLNDVKVGVETRWDDQIDSDYFAGQGALLFQWNNLSDTASDLTYDFDSDQISVLIDYVLDGNFGLGFDPDCHYWNDGITLTIETTPVPEPATMLLLGMGLIGLAGITRKKIKA